MRKGIVFFLIFTLMLAFKSQANISEKALSHIEAATKLIERVTPGYSSQFRLEIIPDSNGCDVFEIGSSDGKVLLSGNNTVSLATAFNQYLKQDCNAHLSWLGDQLSLPEQLPLPTSTRKCVINGKWRVYMNYCTVSYSAAWWDWERWQRELDFMAMNSINMPLSVVGIEAVWYNTLLKHGFSDEDARAFLAGPAHAAWQWMQNLQSYGGPLPYSWIESHTELGKKIMQRELELGMQPIQQGFSGYVPRELIEKYPDAKIRLQPKWCDFTGVAQLDPTDPLFQTIGRDFLEEQKKLYGAHGVYAADPFHESAPPVDTPEYLAEVGKSIHALFENFDAGSTWAMQAWSLRKPIVTAVPAESLLILDLNGEKYKSTEGFWGYPAIVGNLHNFGGRINMHGDIRLLASNQYAKAKDQYPNICGSGLFMESIGQNPAYYDIAFEMPLHSDSVDADRWITSYARRRYGAQSEPAAKAWQILLNSAYGAGTNGTENSSIIAARPALDVKKSGPNAGFHIPYDPTDLISAQKLLLADSSILASSSPYRFDVIDLQRQIMSNLGQEIHKQAAIAFRNSDCRAFDLHSRRFLALLRDADSLLMTRPEYNFNKWIADARRWGTTPEEKDLYERDATSIFTIWGADGDPLIFDYGWKEWAGLIEGYYLRRWENFYDMLRDHLDNGTEYSEDGLKLTHGRESFRANDFYNSLGEWELEYVATSGKGKTPATCGDELRIAARLFRKYADLATEYYTGKSFQTEKHDENRYENLGDQAE